MKLRGLDQVKRDALIEALTQTAGNVTAACRILKISRPTAYDWIQRFELTVTRSAQVVTPS